MSNKAITRSVAVTAVYAPLAAAHDVATVEISTPAGNAGYVTFKDAAGSEMPWEPGEFHRFKGVDLNTIEIKGTVGDTVSIVGGAW